MKKKKPPPSNIQQCQFDQRMKRSIPSESPVLSQLSDCIVHHACTKLRIFQLATLAYQKDTTCDSIVRHCWTIYSFPAKAIFSDESSLEFAWPFAFSQLSPDIFSQVTCIVTDWVDSRCNINKRL